MQKINVLDIPIEHFKTLKDRSKQGNIIRSYLAGTIIHILVPLFVGLVAYCRNYTISSSSNLISGIAIISSLFFALAVMIFEFRIKLIDNKRDANNNERDIKILAMVVSELMDNILWAILSGFLIVAACIIYELTLKHTANNISTTSLVLSSLIISGCMNYILTIAMCLKRVQRIFHAVERLALK